MSKGSNRRKEDAKKVSENWESAFGVKKPKKTKKPKK